MVIREASGADQDEDLYGEWENAKFEPSILEVINKILDVPECKIALDKYSSLIIKRLEEKKRKEREERSEWYDIYLPKINKKRIELGEPIVSIDDEIFIELVEDYVNERLIELGCKKMEKPEEYEYYHISDYSIIYKLDENSHPSYIQAGLEICEHIVANPPKKRKDFNQYQNDQRNDGIEFCKNFINKYKK